MPRALVFGGSGQVGRAVAAALLAQGWEVEATTAAETLPEGLSAVRRLPRPESRAAAIRGGRYDGVVDTMAMTAGDAAELLSVRGAFGRLVVISTASVYADAKGQGFESARFPRYPVPIREDQPRVAPGQGYSAGKAAMEQALDAQGAAILRPGAIWGPGARHPREFWAVKRLLDRRPAIPLAHGGDSRFHTTSAAGLGSFAALCLREGRTGAFNVADPEAETIAARVARIARTLGQEVDLVPMRGRGRVGHTPFSVPRPVVLATDRARALGWDGAEAEAAWAPYLDGLCRHAADWRTAFPAFARYPHDPFDYAAEDAWLRRHRGQYLRGT